MLQLFEHETEIFGVGKTGHKGYFVDVQGAVDQKICRIVDPQLLQVFYRGGLIDLVKMPTELGVGQIHDPTQGGHFQLRVREMLVHILDRVLDGKEGGGLVCHGALLVQLAENGVEQGHALVIISGALAVPGLVDGLESICQNGGVFRCKQLRCKGFLAVYIQIDAKHFLCLGMDRVGAVCGNEQHRAVFRLETVLFKGKIRITPETEREGAVGAGGDGAILGGKMQFDHRQKIKMHRRIGNIHQKHLQKQNKN